MLDALGDRMKDYEARFRGYVNRRSYTILRLDGKSFHTFTKGFDRPYDLTLMGAMDDAAIALCSGIEGAKFAYVQSDEIQVLVTDFSGLNTGMWFDGNIQKMTSISASIATANFNLALSLEKEMASLALFDSRVFQLPRKIEVFNAFVWRQQDAVRNAISMAAQSNFSHKQLENVKTADMLRMLDDKGVDFSSFPGGFKKGRFIERVTYTADVPYIDKRTGVEHIAKNVTRSMWKAIVPPIFTEDKSWLLERIPE